MMFTPRCPSAGPTGGLGFAWPAVICSLISAMTFFATPHLFDDTVEVLEGTVDHLHLLALLEEHLGFGLDCALFHLVRDLADLGLGDRRDRARIGRPTEEARYLWRRFDDVPGLVVEPHV